MSSPAKYDPICSTGEGSFYPPPSSPFVVPHRLDGLFVGNDNALFCTQNLVPGEAVDDEILIHGHQNDYGTIVEYRNWDPYKSKLAAAVLCGADNIWIKPGSWVLCLGDPCGTTISHISDLVGPEGMVYAVEFNNGKMIENMSEKRSNIISIIEKPSRPWRIRMIVGMVDVMVATVTSDDQARTAAVNAGHFLKPGGHYVICVKANRIGLTSGGEDVFTCLGKSHQNFFKPLEQVTLEPYDTEHAYIIGCYRSNDA